MESRSSPISFGAVGKTPSVPVSVPVFERVAQAHFLLKKKEKKVLFTMAVEIDEFKEVLKSAPFIDA